jgi:hypothetical protein
MKLLTFYLCLLCSCSIYAQDVEITRQSTFQASGKSKTLAYIEPQTDTSLFTFVASLKVTGDQRTGIETLYDKVKDKALKMGANAYRFGSYQPGDSARPSVLQLDCYYGQDTVLSQNAGNREKNVVYIFASTRPSDKSSSFKIGNSKKELAGGVYLRHPIDTGQEVKISKGGMMGAAMWIRWQQDRPATFLTLTGLGLAETPFTPGQVNVGFTLGRISYMDDNLGCLLALVLKKEE